MPRMTVWFIEKKTRNFSISVSARSSLDFRDRPRFVHNLYKHFPHCRQHPKNHRCQSLEYSIHQPTICKKYWKKRIIFLVELSSLMLMMNENWRLKDGKPRKIMMRAVSFCLFLLCIYVEVIKEYDDSFVWVEFVDEKWLTTKHTW